ncbi:MAG: disulfide oxidoreductase [Chloroflexi bacterium]|nr:disulfide oxidoreductase [Chloroflexota bacterium]
MVDSTPQAEMTIEVLLHRWPETVIIFHCHKMICIGCQVSAFCTVKEAAEMYSMLVDCLLDELNQAINEKNV